MAATAHNAKLGRSEVARLRPDVLVLDVHLPDQDGISLARELHAEQPELGVILISVEESAQLRRRGQQAGASAYLLKPFEGEDLVAAVRQAAPRKAAAQTPLAASPYPLLVPSLVREKRAGQLSAQRAEVARLLAVEL